MTNTSRITKKDIVKVLAENPKATARDILSMAISDHSLNDEIYAAEQKNLPLYMRDENRVLAHAITDILKAAYCPKSATEICNSITTKYNITATPNKVIAVMKSMYKDRLEVSTKEVEVTTKRKIRVYSI